jgi:ArsR family transcriptional regulator, arsenate/arsenite/antimonite-responsive transcriptional repressor
MRIARKPSSTRVARYARMLSVLGTEPRLRVVRLLLSAHPHGLVASEIASELDIPNSTLSHYLEKLKNHGLVNVRRDGRFLWYTANDEALQELVSFLYQECCTRRGSAPRGATCSAKRSRGR